jgi:hypothetical protein
MLRQLSRIALPKMVSSLLQQMQAGGVGDQNTMAWLQY